MKPDRNWPGLDTVRLETVRAYLEARGYKEMGLQNQRHIIFKNEKYDCVTLPSSPDFADATRCITNAIDRIAEIENRPTYIVLQELVAASGGEVTMVDNANIFKFRVGQRVRVRAGSLEGTTQVIRMCLPPNEFNPVPQYHLVGWWGHRHTEDELEVIQETEEE